MVHGEQGGEPVKVVLIAALLFAFPNISERLEVSHMTDDQRAELSDEVHDQVTSLSEAGNALAEEGDYSAALTRFSEAWNLLPEPKTDWDAATWLLVAIGDVCFLAKRYEEAREALQYAIVEAHGLGNPFIHLRLGQSQYELGNMDRAADELMRAYMGAGPEIFRNDDPKYLAFLGTRAKLD